MKRPVILAVMAIALAWLLVRCSTPQASLRYRMTIEVETPGGMRSGSSVMELRLEREFLIPMPGAGGSDWGGGFTVHGEAPFVDLGDGKVLFATNYDRNYSYLSSMTHIVVQVLGYRELAPPLPSGDNARTMSAAVKAKPSGVLRPKDYPTLVTFTDTSKPKSVVVVSPDNLAAAFGAGYRLGRMTFQVVEQDAPLTATLAAHFPALVDERGRLTLR
ncbi:hypothetical protein QA635_41330 [Bradyrhizobium brasilense]|uniref:hypothetical protein n=1 Tax=Bradyrhizobium brasilense TaxID=1419277 RepID=UPI0024B19200|nr:hypothetical protein [Bradyrhizobium australafricanum]WFU32845.1 hypothetical protein QA635_41330 [Bradyrhizobium australafricanum]